MIKLKYDSGSPYWLNSASVVKIEERRDGGSLIHTSDGKLIQSELEAERLAAMVDADQNRSGSGVGGTGDHHRCPCSYTLGSVDSPPDNIDRVWSREMAKLSPGLLKTLGLDGSVFADPRGYDSFGRHEITSERPEDGDHG